MNERKNEIEKNEKSCSWTKNWESSCLIVFLLHPTQMKPSLFPFLCVNAVFNESKIHSSRNCNNNSLYDEIIFVLRHFFFPSSFTNYKQLNININECAIITSRTFQRKMKFSFFQNNYQFLAYDEHFHVFLLPHSPNLSPSYIHSHFFSLLVRIQFVVENVCSFIHHFIWQVIQTTIIIKMS